MDFSLDDLETTLRIAGGPAQSTFRGWVRGRLWCPPIDSPTKKTAWPHHENVKLAEARAAGLSVPEIQKLVLKLLSDREALKAQLLRYIMGGKAA